MKRNWIKIIGIITTSISCNFAEASECNSIEECISLIPAPEGKAWAQGKVDKTVREKIKSFGRGALIPLVKLTDEDNPNRRLVADSIIVDLQGLEEDDFDAVYQAIQNNIKHDGDGGWSYGALGYIGGDKASSYLVTELKRVQSASNQIGTAFNRLKQEALPYLLDGLRVKTDCSEKEFRGYQDVFDDYQTRFNIVDDKTAIELLKISKDEEICSFARFTALSLIGFIATAPKVAKSVYAYGESNAEFAGSAMISLQKMRSPLAAELLVERLSMTKSGESFFDYNLMIFRDLSEIGHSAIGVGPRVVQYLNSPSWDDRIYAAVTLGHIGYKEAIPELLVQSTNEIDWKQAYAAIKALHLLQDTSSIPHLQKISNSHWYTPLREYAKKVVKSLMSGDEYKSNHHEKNFAMDFLDYQNLSLKENKCDESDYAIIAESDELKIYADKEQNLDWLQYKNPRCSEVEYKKYYRDYCISEQSLISPALAAKYEKMWLSGTNRGEWGGELILHSDNSNIKTLLEENIEDIYVLGENVYAVTGLAHMASNNGVIYKLSFKGTEFDIDEFYRLPGAPRTSWKTDKINTVVINTVSGAVLFNPDEGLTMATCNLE